MPGEEKTRRRVAATSGSGAPGPTGLADWDGFVLYKAGCVLQQLVEEVLKGLGLSGRRFMVLSVLHAQQTLSQAELAELIALDPTTLSALIYDMEAAGLLERERDVRDRRRHTVRPTAVGKRRYQEARAAVDETEDHFFTTLSSRERRDLVDMSQRLMAPHWGDQR